MSVCKFCHNGTRQPGASSKTTKISGAGTIAVAGHKYAGGSGAIVALPPTAGCTIEMAAGGAVAADTADKSCWGVTGLPIIIGDTEDSVMKGFEMVNFNFHVNGSFRATANNFTLPGPTQSGNKA